MLQQNESLNQHVNKISQEGGLQAAQQRILYLGKPSLKKNLTFVTLGSDLPPLFSGKCNEKLKPKKK